MTFSYHAAPNGTGGWYHPKWRSPTSRQPILVEVLEKIHCVRPPAAPAAQAAKAATTPSSAYQMEDQERDHDEE